MTEINIAPGLPSWIKEHIGIYLRDGEAGHLWDSSIGGGVGLLTTLLLTTTGRKSEKQLVLPLIYRPLEGGGFCVIASKGGARFHPAWFLTLEANPDVDLQVGNDKFKGVARIARGDERARLWDLMADYYAPYTDYQAATHRQIPVVVCDPL